MEMLLTLSLCFYVCCPLDGGGDWLVLVAHQSSTIISDDGDNWFHGIQQQQLQHHIRCRRSVTGNSGSVADTGTTDSTSTHAATYPVDITVDSFTAHKKGKTKPPPSKPDGDDRFLFVPVSSTFVFVVVAVGK
uniref:Putative secreted protein n=1 Tax=Anopheles marajoara TaxID=58244 RepID=A0A2M4C6V1_9DIPT